ncbi:hypothetical protein AMTR_s00008p00133760 [Amborella trichopoda]|uniref:Uncharacterized protein n=1 Tax=Amborella trichopoda TaxID=13333 RepID=W1NHP4_AMBTC|nr:hypothetical protein AMTR_s00008p00133760 [Amborella trichopoda]
MSRRGPAPSTTYLNHSHLIRPNTSNKPSNKEGLQPKSLTSNIQQAAESRKQTDLCPSSIVVGEEIVVKRLHLLWDSLVGSFSPTITGHDMRGISNWAQMEWNSDQMAC